MVVTDDDPQLRTFLVNTLRSDGHCVFAAYDGNSACELALLSPDLDLLITVTRWGASPNRALIKSVRNKRPGLPILHIGEPMPNPHGLLDDVPALGEPFTANQLSRGCASWWRSDELRAKPNRSGSKRGFDTRVMNLPSPRGRLTCQAVPSESTPTRESHVTRSCTEHHQP